MTRIYFDNAATTPLDPHVLEAMMPYLTEKFGNPSAIYSYGRETKMAIELARKSVAKNLNAYPAEIFFTSGGTESSNTAILSSVNDLGCKHIITSAIEHHAVLHTVAYLENAGTVKVSYVKLRPDGHVDLDDLGKLLAGSNVQTLVTLMHANNEIGNILDLHAAGNICKSYNAVFHSDTVQTLGHYPFDLRGLPVHFITGAAHKFHGPKGVGMIYINENVHITPFIHGGSQERNIRAGTENVYGIVGLAKALEIATTDFATQASSIRNLKSYMCEELKRNIPGVRFNGDVSGNSLYTVLSTSFPQTDKSEMLLFNLDINNICVSGGSACTSGVERGSHVIKAIYNDRNDVTVRFSFNKYNTEAEVDEVISKLKEFI